MQYKFFGTSHGECLGGEIIGLPKNLNFSTAEVERQLQLRKCGYGRSNRQSRAETVRWDLSELSSGKISFQISDGCTEQREEITAYRPSHADLVGTKRYEGMSARQISEIASARNSVCYVVLGAICKQILQKVGITTYSYTKQIGKIKCHAKFVFGKTDQAEYFASLHCPSKAVTARMQAEIDKMRAVGNSLGGVSVVVAHGVPMGIGEIVPYTARLDSKIAANLTGIPSVKGIEFGIGSNFASADGVSVCEKLQVRGGQIAYQTNYSGGIIGGISTGADIVCNLTIKPVPTVCGVKTIDAKSLSEVDALYERADTCVVPNVGTIAENLLAAVLVEQMQKQNLL